MSATFNLSELERLEALHAAATPGEWSPDIDQDRLTGDLASYQRTGDDPHDWIAPYIAGFEASDGGISDCEAIAALHNAFPAMAKALREAWAHNEKLIEELKETDVRAAEWLGILEKMERERDEARAEVERLKGKLLEEARWVYDTGQRAKDAQAEVERLSAVVQQVHALAATEEHDYRCVRVVENLREIHKITKGMVE